MIQAILRSLRPHQWTKNFFVLAPLVFSGRLFEAEPMGRGALAFAAFCLASSAVYLLNDIRDRDHDRRHPLKRHRPIASGALPVPVAWAVAAGLVLVGGGLALALAPAFAAVLGVYVGLNVLYSGGLKNVVILDVMIVALGFVLRVLGGGFAIPVPVSSWLLLCTILLALFLAFSKRRHEITLLTEDARHQRAVLTQYSPAFLDQMINVVTSSSVVAYALYAISPETTERFHNPGLVYTIPLVLFGIFRYLYLIYQAPSERNPTEQILRDWPFLANLAIWGLVVVAIIYGPEL